MKTISIYTDGSHLDKLNNGRLGCGGVMIDNGGPGFGTKLDEFSQELKPEWLQKYLGTSNVSNPTAEMLGALLALQRFDIPKDADEIIVYADYEGVKYWNTGVWRAKESYIKKIKDDIASTLNQKALTGKVRFEWVKGHQSKSILTSGAYWNNIVDLLAKGQ